jgi:hypothetical protein
VGRGVVGGSQSIREEVLAMGVGIEDPSNSGQLARDVGYTAILVENGSCF